jgi:hypothetical protein
MDNIQKHNMSINVPPSQIFDFIMYFFFFPSLLFLPFSFIGMLSFFHPFMLSTFFLFTLLTSFFSVSLFLELYSLLIPSTVTHLQEKYYAYVPKYLLILLQQLIFVTIL